MSSQCQTPKPDSRRGCTRVRCRGSKIGTAGVLAAPTFILAAWDVNRQGLGQRCIGVAARRLVKEIKLIVPETLPATAPAMRCSRAARR